jgi:hypothetical protein
MKVQGSRYKVQGFIALGPVVYLAGLYYTIDRRGYERGRAEVQARWDAAARLQRDQEAAQAAGAASVLEKDNVKARTVYRTLTRTVDRYIDRPVYRNVCLDADGLRDANAALRGGPLPDPAQPDKPVPGPGSAPGRDGRGGAAEADRGR